MRTTLPPPSCPPAWWRRPDDERKYQRESLNLRDLDPHGHAIGQTVKRRNCHTFVFSESLSNFDQISLFHARFHLAGRDGIVFDHKDPIDPSKAVEPGAWDKQGGFFTHDSSDMGKIARAQLTLRVRNFRLDQKAAGGMVYTSGNTGEVPVETLSGQSIDFDPQR